MSRALKVLIVLFVAFGLVAVLAVAVLFVVSGGRPVDYVQTGLIRLSLQGRQAELDRPVSVDTTQQRFTVNLGDTPRTIAANLYNDGLIANPDLFVDYVRAYDIDVELEAGTYFLRRSQNIREIAQALTDSRNSQIIFSIIPGWRMEEVAQAVGNNPLFGFTSDDFLRVVSAGAPVDPAFAERVGLPAGASLEGFLFPNTYSLPPDITAEGLRDTLLEEFIREIEAAGIETSAKNMSIFEIVTLASIVQREAVHMDEGAKIAGVYVNRLNMGMRLDADPTVQYPLGTPGDWWTQITQADYRNTISPYNTYLNFGLPPGPIANPSLAAIRAAANPEPTSFVYFRAECSGSGYHRFALTFEEHLANGCS